MNLQFLLSCLVILLADRNVNAISEIQQNLTCIGASSENSGGLCSFVNWNHARMFSGQPNFLLSNQPSLISTSYQSEFANNLYMEYSGYGSSSKKCLDYAKYFACFLVFPECPFAGNTKYFPPCRSVCEKMKLECTFHIDCMTLMRDGCLEYTDVVLGVGERSLPYAQVSYWNTNSCLNELILTIRCSH